MSTHPIGDSSTSNSDHARAKQLHQAGIVAYKQGERTQAHLLWQQSAYLNPKNQAVWFALYQVAQDDADRITCLENALRLNTKNPRVAERLQDLQRRQRIMKGIFTPAEPIQSAKRLSFFGGFLLLILTLCLIGLIVGLLHFQIIP
jgi:hypothetical protein